MAKRAVGGGPSERRPAENRIAEVDAYIERAAPFAQPILSYLRDVLHEGAPGVTETIKWSRPFFMLAGRGGEVILGNISGFKQHCSLGLWGTEMAAQLRADGVASGEGMGSFGRVSAVGDLPPRATLVGYVREAARAIAEGERTRSYTRPRKVHGVVKVEVEVPEELAAALSRNKAAAKVFAGKGPGWRREYCDWVGGAKREETRAKRAADAVAWIAEAKGRNWQYETR